MPAETKYQYCCLRCKKGIPYEEYIQMSWPTYCKECQKEVTKEWEAEKKHRREAKQFTHWNFVKRVWYHDTYQTSGFIYILRLPGFRKTVGGRRFYWPWKWTQFLFELSTWHHPNLDLVIMFFGIGIELRVWIRDDMWGD